MMMSGQDILRRFRKPEDMKKHIKNYSNRYFVAKLVTLSKIYALNLSVSGVLDEINKICHIKSLFLS